MRKQRLILHALVGLEHVPDFLLDLPLGLAFDDCLVARGDPFRFVLLLLLLLLLAMPA